MAMMISQLAAEAGVRSETVRYYERRGLMPHPQRRANGYREYESHAVRRLRFIRRGQELGFSLVEIGELLALRVDHVAACGKVEARTREKIALVERKIVQLGRMKLTLERLARSCREREPTGDCPVLEMLEDRSESAAEGD